MAGALAMSLPADPPDREAALRALIAELHVAPPPSRLPTLAELAAERPDRLPPARLAAILGLSKQLRVVLDHLGEGRDNDDVAYRMHLSKDTVETHCRALRTRLALRTRSELMALAGFVAATRPDEAERAGPAPAADRRNAASPLEVLDWARRLQG